MFQHILVLLDGSPIAESAIPYAAALARQYGGHIELVQVVPTVQTGVLSAAEASRANRESMRRADGYLAGVGRRLREQGVAADWTVEPGDEARAALRCAADMDADLVVITSRGGGGSKEAFGAVAERVLRHAKRPVLVLRPPPNDPIV